MQKIISKIISVIFHPIIMPSAGVFLLFNSKTYISLVPALEKEFVYYIVIGCTFVLPLLITPFFIFNSFISNPELDKKEDRKIPYFITLCFNYLAYYILRKISAPDIIVNFILSCFISITLTMLLSLKFKVSAHMVGVGGVTALILVLSYTQMINADNILILLFSVSGLIGYARLYLNAHKPVQIYAGYFLGLTTVIVTFIMMRYYL
jgi:hypothetical protein